MSVNIDVSLDYSNLNNNSVVNVLDYIPIISNISGVVRSIFGTIEAVVGIPTFPIELFVRATGARNTFLFVDGIANIIRGSVASTPLLGNVTLYLYDHSPMIKKDFQFATGLRL